jgi:hypothetical protein
MTHRRSHAPITFVVAAFVLAVVAGGPVAIAMEQLAPSGQPPASTETSSPPDGMQLQQGYRHRRIPTIDGTQGVVWKEGGPRIHYEIDFTGLSQGVINAPTASGTWRINSTSTNGHRQEIVFDEDANRLVVGVGGFGRFTATDIKSRRDLAEVLLTILTYDPRMPHSAAARRP